MTSPAPAILGLDPASLSALLWGVCVFALLVAGYALIVSRDPMTKRVRAFNEPRALRNARFGSVP